MEGAAIATFYWLYRADEPKTTSDLAKEAFDPKGDDELRNADKKVRYHLEEQFPHLVEAIDRDGGPKLYRLKEDSLYIGVGKIDAVTLEAEEITIGLGDVLIYRTEAGTHTVVSIDAVDDSQ